MNKNNTAVADSIGEIVARFRKRICVQCWGRRIFLSSPYFSQIGFNRLTVQYAEINMIVKEREGQTFVLEDQYCGNSSSNSGDEKGNQSVHSCTNQLN
jgi:hypothetical protein